MDSGPLSNGYHVYFQFYLSIPSAAVMSRATGVTEHMTSKILDGRADSLMAERLLLINLTFAIAQSSD
jgi:hypothetical protein